MYVHDFNLLYYTTAPHDRYLESTRQRAALNIEGFQIEESNKIKLPRKKPLKCLYKNDVPGTIVTTGLNILLDMNVLSRRTYNRVTIMILAIPKTEVPV